MLRIAFAAGASGTAGWLRPVDPEWLERIRFRDGYIFVSLWGPRAVRNLALFWIVLAVGILAQRRLAPGALHRRSWTVAAVCGLLLVAGIVLVEVVPVQLALQLQLLRSSYLVIYLGMILLAGALWTAASRLRRPALRVGVSTLLVVGALTGIALSRPEGPAVLDLPGRRAPSAWRDVGVWCREHTPPDALFLVPPDGLPGFRVHARRSIVVEWKDGAPLVFSRRYAEEWWSRMGDLWGYADFDDDRFRELHERYGANYAVTRATRLLGFPELYRNGEFVVWDLRP